ncbi:MAG: hypothetical protein KC777_17670 [Cyanobacteria bacterium HKST-UBA02]|nr:hypothetical protein [Cyanobacteria bacterium HKST-UBA02]
MQNPQVFVVLALTIAFLVTIVLVASSGAQLLFSVEQPAEGADRQAGGLFRKMRSPPFYMAISCWCLLSGFFWTQITGCLVSYWCDSCQSLSVHWVGRDRAELSKAFGEPWICSPTDDDLAKGFTDIRGDVSVQDWRYRDKLFLVRVEDKKIISAELRDHKHLLDILISGF